MSLKSIVRSLMAVSLAAFQLPLLWGQGPFDPKQNAEQGLKNGIKQAKQVHKNILLDFGANWCAPCVSLDLLLETDPGLKRLLVNGFVLVRVPVGVERDSRPTRAVRSRYPPFTLVPHLLILNSDGFLMAEQKVVSLMADPSAMRWDHERLAEFLGQCGAPKVCRKGL